MAFELETIRNQGAGLPRGMPTAQSDSSNVIRLRPPRPSTHSPLPSEKDGVLLELLTALNGQSLQSAFTAMDLLQVALDQLEAKHAASPDHPQIQRLGQETARLSCELFAARMMAVRLSLTLAHLRQGQATSHLDQTASLELALRSGMAGN